MLSDGPEQLQSLAFKVGLTHPDNVVRGPITPVVYQLSVAQIGLNVQRIFYHFYSELDPKFEECPKDSMYLICK